MAGTRTQARGFQPIPTVTETYYFVWFFRRIASPIVPPDSDPFRPVSDKRLQQRTQWKRFRAGRRLQSALEGVAPASRSYFIVTLTGFDAMPFAMTTSVLAPVSIFAGTSKLVETGSEPVATPIVL